MKKQFLVFVLCGGTIFTAPMVAAQDAAANAFNPVISLVLSGTYSQLSQDPATYSLPGFSLGDAASPGNRGLGINATELHFHADIDTDLYGALALILNPDNTVSLEEAYLKTTGVGDSFVVKAGRFFSAIGAINQKHPHDWDFVDEPLTYRAFLNYQYGDDGVQLRWAVPVRPFIALDNIELGGEILKGSNFVAGENSKNGVGAHSLFVHVGNDTSQNQHWRAGVAYLNARPEGRALVNYSGDAATGQPDTFSGKSKLWSADFIWKWVPSEHHRVHQTVIQGEYFLRKESGVTNDAASAMIGNFAARQSGWHVQGLYQLMPRWRAGVRYDRLVTHNLTDDSGTLTNVNYLPSRSSVILEFTRSAASRLRLQYNHDQSRRDSSDHQMYVQYQVRLGGEGEED